MALKDNWVNKVDEVDDVLAEDINNIASAVIDLENKEIVAPVTSVNGKTGAVEISKSDVGLGNVDNTSDMSKPVSNLMRAALNGKLDVQIGYQDNLDDYMGNGQMYYIKGQTEGIILFGFNPYYLYSFAYNDTVSQIKIDFYGMHQREYMYFEGINDINGGVVQEEGWRWTEWESFSSVTVVDNLESTSVEKALSANQGRVLNEKIGDIETALDSIIEIQNELMGVSE